MITNRRTYFLATAESLPRTPALPEIRYHSRWPIRSLSAEESGSVRQWLLTHDVTRPNEKQAQRAAKQVAKQRGQMRDLNIDHVARLQRRRHQAIFDIVQNDGDEASRVSELEETSAGISSYDGLAALQQDGISIDVTLVPLLPMPIDPNPPVQPIAPSADPVEERREANRAEHVHRLRRKCVECNGRIAPHARSDREFCGAACTEKARRRRVKKREETRVYAADRSIMQFNTTLVELTEDYAESAGLMKASALQRNLEVEIVATPLGILVAADDQAEIAAAADRNAMISRHNRKIVEIERMSTDTDVVTFIRNALQQRAGLSVIELERSETTRAQLNQILQGAERSIRILSFGAPLPHDLAEEGTRLRTGNGPEAPAGPLNRLSLCYAYLATPEKRQIVHSAAAWGLIPRNPSDHWLN